MDFDRNETCSLVKKGDCPIGRRIRQWQPNVVYHITNRGNQKSTLFHDAHDFEVFLRILENAHRKIPFQLYAYCLMTNHYHLLLSTEETPLSHLMAWLNKRYADYFNNRYNSCGHVFEKRFYSQAVGVGYGLLYVSRYIHINPVIASLVDGPAKYPWSSYSRYIGRSTDETSCLVDPTRTLSFYKGNLTQKQTTYKQFVSTFLLEHAKRSP